MCVHTESKLVFCASEKPYSVCSLCTYLAFVYDFSPVLFPWELVYLDRFLIFRPEFVRTGLAKAEKGLVCVGALVCVRSCLRSVLLIFYGDLHRLFACVLTCCSLGF